MTAVSVVLPVHPGHADLLGAALATVGAQTSVPEDLVVVLDGAPAVGAAVVARARLSGPRVVTVALPGGVGLGAALNAGLDRARGGLVAYLAADDLWDPDHLERVVGGLDAGGAAVLAGTRGGEGLELSALAHRATAGRWVVREVLESDDLARLAPPVARSPTALTGASVTVRDHPDRRRRALRASCDGGPNAFRARYGVPTPLRLSTSEGLELDEVRRYAPWRGSPPTPRPGGLRILLVGELAYNPERILALAERGHELLGLWIADPLGFMAVGPLPFPGVRDVGLADWEAQRPDVIYAGLNWRAVGLAHHVLERARRRGIPVVWHAKEAPQRSLARGEWPLLAELHRHSAARLACSDEHAAHLEAVLPGQADPATSHVLDGDLPRAHWATAGTAPPRLSQADGRVHTALVGRTYGFATDLVRQIAAAGAVLHLHGARAGPDWPREAVREHGPVEPEDWRRVLGAYDATWLHPHRSANGGDLRRATWDDLNLPARLATSGLVGVPVLQPANPGHAVATQSHLRRTGAGVLLDAELTALRDPGALGAARAAAQQIAPEFAFEHHADRLERILVGASAG